MTEKDKLIKMVQDNEEVQRYKRIEKIMNSNKDLKRKIQNLKVIQKQLINAKEIGKMKAYENFERIYYEQLEAIESYPLMSDYLALQGDINEMVQQILTIIEEGIQKDLEI